MLGISINNEFLDLSPGTALEIERQNPFFSFNDEETSGEYSLPFAVQNTAKNIRLLHYAALPQQRVSTSGIEALLYDNGLQESAGKIKFEQINHDLNRTAGGGMSLYYLTGSSSFFQDIKDVKLRGVNVGGDRSFVWDNLNPDGNGFWGHIHSVINAAPGSIGPGMNGYDYAFYPLINKSFLSGNLDSSELVNNMVYTGGKVRFAQNTSDNKGPNLIVPFPYLGYVLQKAVQQVGWRIEGDILNDPDFKKITIVNFTAILWTGPWGPAPLISFNLQESLPDITIAQFIKGIASRLGLWLDFDRRKKVIKLSYLREKTGVALKDYTTEASPLISKKVATEKVVYALKNKFTGDYADGKPDLKNFAGIVNYASELPAATESLYGKVYMVRIENNYYICQQNDDKTAYLWELYAYNVYDVEPDGHNQEITTDATTLGSEKYNDFLDFVPRMDAAGYLPYTYFWGGSKVDGVGEPMQGLVLLPYHGLQFNKNNQPYPFASSGVYNSSGMRVANWSLSFKCFTLDEEEVGLYERNWKPVLDALAGSETLTITLYLSKAEYLKLNFGDIISIAGVRMMIKKMKSTIPYAGKVELECNRLP